jgi:glycosyltransferase involved in cell wall biosynthesis
MRRLRVALIIATLDRAGGEKQVALLARRLDPERFDVRVVAVTRGGPYEDDLRRAGIPVHVLGKSWKYDPRAVTGLRRLLMEHQADVAYTWMFTANAFGRAAAHLARTPVVIAGEMYTGPKPPLHHRVDRFLARWTDCIVANSEGVRRYCVRHGWPGDKIRVIHNGIELDEIDRAAEPSRPLPPVPPGHTLAVTACRLSREKGLLYLMWAIGILRYANAKVHLWIVGDGPERGRLEYESARLRVEPYVDFLGQRRDVAAILRRADLFVLPSLHEGLSNVVLEAMLAGTPVVVTDVGGMRELLDDGRCGAIVEPGYPKGIAAGIYQMMVHRERRERMARLARERVRDLFSAERFVRAHEDLFVELARKKGLDV